MAEQIAVSMNAARVCDAIARIGYSPASALMDVVDNAVTAGATRIVIAIDTDTDKTYAQNNNVVRYQVIDNGCGMTDEEVLNALRLGTEIEYEADSLSKYGMGLKAAGLSIGSRISLLSSKGGRVTRSHYIDRQTIQDAGQYVVCRETAPNEQAATLSEFLDGDDSGTLIEISKCARRNHASAKKTIDYLQQRLGVTYYGFLSDPHRTLTLTIRCTDKPEVVVQPRDMLFLDDAGEQFDPDQYDCKSPVRVLHQDVPMGDDEADPPVTLDVVLFPRAKMAAHPDLDQDQRARIKGYAITRGNHGVFIYRNGRLIRWADTLEGIISRDDIGFRARMEIRTAHDDCLHVDVSKQHLSIPEDILDRLETILRIPLGQGREIFALCSEMLKQDEGVEFNERNQDLVEEDLDVADEPVPNEQTRERRRQLAEETRQTLEDEEGAQAVPTEVDEILPFEKVRYSDRVRSSFLWEAGFSSPDGTFVRVNKNHPFYPTVLARLDTNSAGRQALEALLWALAAGENLTRQNFAQFDDETIRSVIDRMKRVVATTLDRWSQSNQDLFDAV